MRWLRRIVQRLRESGQEHDHALPSGVGTLAAGNPDSETPEAFGRTASFVALLSSTTRVRVWDSGEESRQAPHVLAEVVDPAALDRLRAILERVVSANSHRMSYAAVVLELVAADASRLASIDVLDSARVRWTGWDCDAQVDPAILEWLDEHGVRGPLASYREVQAMYAAWRRWHAAAPRCLREMPASSLHKALERRDLAPVMAALAADYPHPRALHLALLQWFGSGVGSWAEYPEYELFAELVLRACGVEAVCANIAAAELNVLQIEGAARLFVDANSPTKLPWRFLPGYRKVSRPQPTALVALPAELQARLVRHCVASEDADKRARAQALVVAGTSSDGGR